MVQTSTTTTTTTATPRFAPVGERQHPIARGRTAAAVILSTVAVAIGIVLHIAFGATATAIYAFGLPVSLILLWASSDTLRSDEEPREHE